MSKKFSIMTTINFEKLDKEIQQYTNLNYCSDPYIFMSEDTANAIEETLKEEMKFDAYDFSSNINSNNGVKAAYCGYKVFIDNDLKLGVVEIR